jgi:protocatechuate 3,4-dioxygenase beta subunit
MLSLSTRRLGARLSHTRSATGRSGQAAIVVVVVLVLAALVAAFFLLGGVSGPAKVVPSGGAATSAGTGAAGAVELVGSDAAAAREEVARTAIDAGSPETELVAALEDVGDEADTARLVGRILDDAGRPIGGAQVALGAGFPGFGGRGRDRGQETKSALDGSFVFERAPVGQAALTASAPGCATARRDDLAFAAGGRYDVGDIALERAVLLRGVVVDEQGRGIEGVELRETRGPDGGGGIEFISFGRRSGTLLATSGPGGAFEIATLAAGPWRVTAEHPEHPVRSFDGATKSPGESVHDLRFELPDGAAIAGRLVGMAQRPGRYAVEANSTRAEGPIVFGGGGFGIGAQRTDVADDGTFRIGGLEKDVEYELVALRVENDNGAAEFAGPFGSSPVSEKQTVLSGTLDARIEVLPAGRLTLSVVDARTGEPVEDFTVSYGSNWGPRELRGADGAPVRRHPGGRALFEDVPMGRTEQFEGRPVVKVDAEGFITSTTRVEPIAAGSSTDLGTIALERAPQARIRVRGAMGPVAAAQVTVGRVTSNGVEVEGGVAMTFTAAISADGGETEEIVGGPQRSARARTNEEGLATLSLPVTSGRVELRVEHGEYAPFVGQVELVEGQDLEHEVVLGPGGVAIVRVLDAAGAPLPWIGVEHRAPADRGFGGDLPRTDANGVVRFERLAPGKHRFRTSDAPSGGMFVFSGSESGSAWTDVEFEHGDEQVVELVHSTGVTVRGVVRQDGEPLAAARVSLEKRSPDGGAQSVRAIAVFSSIDIGDGGAFMSMGGQDLSDRTDGEGRYEIEGVAPGDYTLTVRHDSRAGPATFDVIVTAGGDLVRDVDLSRNGVRGTVRDDEGEPVAGAHVSISQSGGGGMPFGGLVVAGAPGVGGAGSSSATTDAQGRYELAGLDPEKDFQVVVDSSGEAPYHLEARSESMRVGEGEWKDDVDLVVRRGGSLEIVVAEDRAEEFAFATVRAVQLDGAGAPIEGSDAFGFLDGRRAVVNGLEPGKWRVQVETMVQGAGPAARDVDVRAGERATLEF